jgi:hypothetical protein
MTEQKLLTIFGCVVVIAGAWVIVRLNTHD